MKTLLDTLVLQNPMRIEIARFRRRFLGFGGSGLTSAVLALVLLCYLGVVLLVIHMQGDLPPVALILLQTGLFCFFGPAMLHGAVAGERERRSWDLLLVAPITKAQIVMGKFMGAVAALGLGAGAFVLPISFSALAYGKTSFYDLALAEAVSLTFCMLVCAGTIFFSARVRRPFMALGVTIGSLAVGLGVIPALVAALVSGHSSSVEAALYPNPFMALAALMTPERSKALFGSEAAVEPSWYGVPHALIYLGLTAVLLVYAEKTLHFPDNEIKFMPRGHRDA